MDRGEKAMANHYFYAVLLPEAFKQKLQQATAGLKGSLPFKRWVHRDDLHITLAFLGAAEEAQLEKANRLIADQIGAFHVLPLVFDHFGTFGKKTNRVYSLQAYRNHRRFLILRQWWPAAALKQVFHLIEDRFTRI